MPGKIVCEGSAPENAYDAQWYAKLAPKHAKGADVYIHGLDARAGAMGDVASRCEVWPSARARKKAAAKSRRAPGTAANSNQSNLSKGGVQG